MLKSAILFTVTAIITNFLLQTKYISELLNLDTNIAGLFTKKQLSNYNGIQKNELYLSILGKVFDVTKGAKYYGFGEGYHIFIGHDNSKNFVDGKFTESEISDEVISFNNQELRSLNQWVKFYRTEYTYVGKLIGKYYNEKGKLTPYGREVKLLIKTAEQSHVNDDLDKLKFPPCNVEWEPEKGTRVWCTKRSGGIERDWVGVPRKRYEVGAQDYRCACIHDDNKDLGTILEYEGCDPESSSCEVKI